MNKQIGNTNQEIKMTKMEISALQNTTYEMNIVQMDSTTN